MCFAGDVLISEALVIEFYMDFLVWEKLLV